MNEQTVHISQPNLQAQTIHHHQWNIGWSWDKLDSPLPAGNTATNPGQMCSRFKTRSMAYSISVFHLPSDLFPPVKLVKTDLKISDTLCLRWLHSFSVTAVVISYDIRVDFFVYRRCLMHDMLSCVDIVIENIRDAVACEILASLLGSEAKQKCEAFSPFVLLVAAGMTWGHDLTDAGVLTLCCLHLVGQAQQVVGFYLLALSCFQLRPRSAL